MTNQVFNMYSLMQSEKGLEGSLKDIIETKLSVPVSIVAASDSVNLMFEAFSCNECVARIYKSFDRGYDRVVKIRYTLVD